MGIKTTRGDSGQGVAVTPERARAALIMTAREYIRTKEYKIKTVVRRKQLLSSIMFGLKPFQKMAGGVIRQLQDSGTLEQIRYIQQEYAKLLRNIKPDRPITFYKKYDASVEQRLSSEDIEKIARRSAYYLIHMKLIPGDDFPIQFVLTPDGDLYKQSEPALRYRMRGEALRLKILRALIGNNSYCPSREIMNDVRAASYGSFTKAIGAMNMKARGTFKLSRSKIYNFIISKPHSGYMINRLYAIRCE
jgi:hypothetical protein